MNKVKKAFGYIKKLPKKIKIIGIIGIVIIAGFFIYKNFFLSKSATTYQTSKVTKGSIITTVSESGNVAAGSQVTIASTTDGVIEELYVKNGDIIGVGQDLFKVKSTATPQEKASAYASYLSAVASEKNSESSKISAQSSLEKDRQSVINASSTVTDMQNNLDNGRNNPSTDQLYTQNEIESIKSTLFSAQKTFKADEIKFNNSDTNISSSKASLTSSWLAYQATQDSIVTAPVDGTVANLSATIGSAVTSGNNTNSTNSTSTSSTSSSVTPVLILGNFSNLLIKTQVNEIDIPNIHVDQNATITLDAFSGKTFVGKVYSVDSVGTNNSGVVTYNVYITFISPPSFIQAGMTASAIIQTDRQDNVLKVPLAAVQTNNGQSSVRLLNKNNQVTQISVETGLSSDSETEIKSGLNEDETVVTATSTKTTGTTRTTSPFGGGFGGGGALRGR
ncbi:MAG: HlyD family efflux transporter periplasmic adaptor subunit [bacterium]|nr:HlyD family efflux transporter periplasmic adaptor subunit [bacterium]